MERCVCMAGGGVMLSTSIHELFAFSSGLCHAQ